MDAKSVATLEFNKILERLSGYAAFSASAALLRALRPTNDLILAQERQARTSQARRLLAEFPETSIGGARDVRPQVELAGRGGVLTPQDLLDVKATLISSRDLQRFFSKLEFECPHLQAIAADLTPPPGLIEAITQTITENAEVADGASQRLDSLRREVKAANERILAKLEKLIGDSRTSAMLQEAIITKRNGRYVVPLRAEFKSRMRCVVQDQSASGATLFVEPLNVVEMNNAWNEAVMAEKEEERRILAELSAAVGAQISLIQANVRALATLDMAFACAKYADDLGAAEPLLLENSGKTDEDEQTILHFTRARHPLLDPQSVVPIDIALEKGTRALVITGPNTGGKTVSLKTAGLLVLMAQAGLHIPAQSGSRTRIFRDVFADIGDEQSIEQSLSTFSGHVTNIVRILQKADARSLVIFDELGAGTDPQEGSALARAILAYLLRRNIPALIATHYPELKAYAHNTPGALNASVEFDLQSLKPTYRLIMGLPGRSNALAIAARLGIRDEIIQDAREMIDPGSLRTEDLLDEIHRQLEQTRREHAEAENLKNELETQRREMAEKLQDIENERLAVLEEARRQSLRELEELRAEMETIRKDARETAGDVKEKKNLAKKIAGLEEKASEPLDKKEYGSPSTPRPLRVGDRVHLRNLKTDGEVLDIGDDIVEVQIGKMRVKVDLRNIERSGKGTAPSKTKAVREERQAVESSSSISLQPSPGVELHLRGLRGDEALEQLDRYLDSAYASGLPFARIVHGKGTGALRQLVRQALGASPLVARWENAMDNEGGEGVTIVHFTNE
ncbi:MAG: endonuclease MutS2 [Anaerolineae bacterium]|nr:endonuclease MutS2 [Anaerolineae bacterium]